jgi:predicted RNase H-like nuclease
MAEKREPRPPVAGIDGCRGGWLAARWQPEGDLAFRLERSLSALLPQVRVHRIWLDMPIGTAPPGEAVRRCDHEARRFLGGRAAASLFSPPCREAMGAGRYAEALALNRRHTGKGFSVQAWNLVPKIREVARLLEDFPALEGLLEESHPEVCLRALAPGRSFDSKHTAEGRAQRREFLATWIADYPAILDEALVRHPRKRAGEDDFHDAALLAVAAAQAADWFSADGKGAPPRIAYPVPSPCSE